MEIWVSWNCGDLTYFRSREELLQFLDDADCCRLGRRVLTRCGAVIGRIKEE